MKAYLLFTFFLFTIVFEARSQSACDADLIFAVCEEPAKLITSNVEIEEGLLKAVGLNKKDKGEIAFKFTINCKGEIAEIATMRNSTLLNTEAMETWLLENLKWEPAKHRNVSVDYYRSLLIKVKGKKFQIKN